LYECRCGKPSQAQTTVLVAKERSTTNCSFTAAEQHKTRWVCGNVVQTVKLVVTLLAPVVQSPDCSCRPYYLVAAAGSAYCDSGAILLVLLLQDNAALTSPVKA
jgi:ribosomal protein S27AE